MRVLHLGGLTSRIIPEYVRAMRVLLLFPLVLVFVVLGCGDDGDSVPPEPSATMNAQEPPILNAREWAAASEMLARAGELVEERGFQQGAVTVVDQECVATALEHSFEEKDYSIVDFNYAREALSRVLGVEREPPPQGDLLAVPYWGSLLMEWNDAPGRTEEEVVDAFRDAADLADSLRLEAIELGLPALTEE